MRILTLVMLLSSYLSVGCARSSWSAAAEAASASHAALLTGLERAEAAPRGVAPEHADTLAALRNMLGADTNADDWRRVFELAPLSDEGLVTGYFAPVYEGRLTPDERFRFPLYRRPADDRIATLTRRELAQRDALRGLEIVWLDNALDAYLIHVNGSARILTERGPLDLSHDGVNEQPYTSLGRRLIETGHATRDDMNLDVIVELFATKPDVVRRLMRENDRFVYFRAAPSVGWPVGSSGAVLTAGVSAAFDASIVGAGGVVLIETPELTTLAIVQDTGGAIVGPARLDLFHGVGPAAGVAAGRLLARGRLSLLRARTSDSTSR